MDLPKDDPRRLKHAGDLEKAYPESAKEKAHRTEIDAVISFLTWLNSKKQLFICEEVTPESEESDEQESETEPYLFWPITRDPWSHKFQRLAFEWQGVDFDAFFHGKDVMFEVLAQAQAERIEQKEQAK